LSECNLDVLHLSCGHYHVIIMNYQYQLSLFTAIHKSSPVPSWDSEESMYTSESRRK